MCEKQIVQSENYSLKLVKTILAIVGISVALILGECTGTTHFSWYLRGFILHPQDLFESIFKLVLLSGAIFAGLLVVALFFLRGFALTVTDKRVYGKIRWFSRVDLPVDSISAVSKGIFKSVGVATSSGRISFLFVKNRDEIHDALSDLIVSRQNDIKAEKQREEKQEATTIVQQASSADELKKFKELLDAGIITQEEFDAKKKHLLGL